MEFTTHSRRYKISDFYQHFGKALPKVVIVTDGYFGETEDAIFDAGQGWRCCVGGEYGADCCSQSKLERGKILQFVPHSIANDIRVCSAVNFQIIRFHTCSKQRRIKAIAKETDSSSETVYSIPLDHPNPMIICDNNRLGKDKAWKPLLLKDIIENHKLPLTVQLDKTDTCEDVTSSRISMVTLREGFDEIFLLGNAIENGCLNMRIVSVPVNSKGMTVALVIGIPGRTAEEWSQYCMELNETVVSSISFSHRFGPSGIRLFKPKSIHRKRQPLRSLGLRLSKLFLSRSSLSMPEGEKTFAHSPSTTEGHGLCGETNAELQNYPPLRLATRTVSKYNKIDDSQIHLMYGGKAIKTVTDVSNLLKKLKLERYLTLFKEKGIDEQNLFKLSEQVLQEEYNFRRVDAVKLMSFIRTGHIPQ